jgi:hypothetical protein
MTERNFHGDPNVAAVVACQGHGKSTLQRMLVRAWPAHIKVIYDHKRQFQQLLPAFGCETLQQCQLALQQTRSVCFVPFRLYQENIEEGLADFAEWFWKQQQLAGGHVKKLFVFDEAGDMIPDNYKEWKKHPVRKFTNTGREWGIDVCAAAQAPTDIPLKFRNQVNQWFVGKLGDPDCLGKLVNQGLRWEHVASLPPGHFIHLDKKTGAIRTVVTDPKA